MLVGLFLILYRNCDKKGFDRLYVSIKMAILIAGTLAGLIVGPVEATNPRVSNNSPPMERIFNLSGGDQSKFDPGAKTKADTRRNAKGSGSSLIQSADGFASSGNYRPYQKPLSSERAFLRP